MSTATTKSKEEGSSSNGGAAEELAEPASDNAAKESRNEDDEEEEDDEDTEPILKYTRLTSSLASVYRNGDSTSAFAATGDKLILGTNNGNVNIFSTLTLQPVRSYRAHTVSVTAISVSPHSPKLSLSDLVDAPEPSAQTPSSPAARALAKASASSPQSSTRVIPKRPTPANTIHIATASIDGQVCVASLTDTKEVTVRNFGRPVLAVALSPDYKTDHTYLSGGIAGNLIVTVGGQVGVVADANTNSASAAASGWLGSIGLGSNTGKDTVLRSGEGSISNIKWSLSGKYVAFANEEGVRILRTHLHLPSSAADSAWKSVSFIAKPNRRSWQDMAAVWKAHLEWVDDKLLESLDIYSGTANGSSTGKDERPQRSTSSKEVPITSAKEKLLIGWGDTAWIIEVRADSAPSASTASALGKAKSLHTLEFRDEIISGLSLYTPDLLLVLIYRTRDDNNRPVDDDDTPRKGRQRKQNGLPPDLRLVDLNPPESAFEDVSLTMSRFESLTATNYHLSTIYVQPASASTTRPALKSTFDSLSGLGGGLWDASINATRILGSGASVMSTTSGGSKVGASTNPSPKRQVPPESLSALVQPGLKVFIQSPFDSVLAIKRDLADRLQWLLEHRQYKEAWELIDVHPEVVSAPASNPSRSESRPSTPSKTQSLADFFDDSASESTAPTDSFAQAVAKEKRRIGDLWVQQLVDAEQWETAGQVAGRVLGFSPRWEHWILTFAQAKKFDEITPHVPVQPLKPRLPSYVYELILRHYISRDRPRFKELLDKWHPGLFDIPSIISSIDNKLESGDVREDTVEGGERGRDWQILLEALARLYLIDDRPTEAFRCFLHTRNADAAFELVRGYKLFDAISSEIWPFVQLRTPRDAKPSLEELDDLSSEAIHLLCSAAVKGVISPETVVSQLEDEGEAAKPYLFFYLRSLWNGETASLDDDASTVGSVTAGPVVRRGRFARGGNLVLEDTGRTLAERHANLVVTLFADYDRNLLSSFLRQSRAYSFEHADAVCESRNLITELVHLLSTTGESVRALHLIIDRLGDVRMAIDFAKEVDEPSLWDELLEYSMDKPPFVKGLLEEVGTAIDPVSLVKRIPEGLEIPGLKEGLTRLVHESEVMHSIAEGAAKVMRGEVGGELEALQSGRLKGVVFDGVQTEDGDGQQHKGAYCSVCEAANFPSADALFAGGFESEHLIGFPCGHIFHLSCVLDAVTTAQNGAMIGKLQKDLSLPPGERDQIGRVQRKMALAQTIKRALGDSQVCLACAKDVHVRDDGEVLG